MRVAVANPSMLLIVSPLRAFGKYRIDFSFNSWDRID